MSSVITIALYRRRRGSAYILVLGMGTLAMVAGLAAVTVGRIQLRGASAGNDAIRAEALAESAVELALARLVTDANWRTTYTNGVETASVPFAGGTLSFKLVDESDGSLSNNPADHVRIYGVGRYGSATRIYSVHAAGKDALTCLNAPLVAGGTATFSTATVIAAGMTLAANGDIHGGSVSGTINGNLEAGGTVYIETATLNGVKQSNAPTRAMPGDEVFDSYIAKGTGIPYNALPVDGSGRTLSLCVLSPGSNPFGGSTNPGGVYVIDCQNQKLTIVNCRIVGTLVILNPGLGSCVGNSNGDPCSWVSAVNNYPCLLVKGDMTLSFGRNANATLSESTVGINFNPAGTPYPYPGGPTNATLDDVYPSRIAGLVYISGNAATTSSYCWTRIDMLVVGGNYDATHAGISPVYSNLYLGYPPPGFTGLGQLVPVPGTWRWEKAP